MGVVKALPPPASNALVLSKLVLFAKPGHPICALLLRQRLHPDVAKRHPLRNAHYRLRPIKTPDSRLPPNGAASLPAPKSQALPSRLPNAATSNSYRQP